MSRKGSHRDTRLRNRLFWALLIAALVVGQLIMSAVIDHFGILNVPIVALSPNRIAGMVLLMAGLYLIQRQG